MLGRTLVDYLCIVEVGCWWKVGYTVLSLRSSRWGAGHVTHPCRSCWEAQGTCGTPRPHLNHRNDTMSENLTPDTVRGVAQDLGASLAPPLSQSAEQNPGCRRSSGWVFLS